MDTTRTEVINFRAAKAEKEALEIMSTYERINQSEMIRGLIREGMRIRGLHIFNISENQSVGVPSRNA